MTLEKKTELVEVLMRFHDGQFSAAHAIYDTLYLDGGEVKARDPGKAQAVQASDVEAVLASAETAAQISSLLTSNSALTAEAEAANAKADQLTSEVKRLTKQSENLAKSMSAKEDRIVALQFELTAIKREALASSTSGDDVDAN